MRTALKILGAVALWVALALIGVVAVAFIGGLFDRAGAAATSSALPIVIIAGVAAYWLVFRLRWKQRSLGTPTQD